MTNPYHPESASLERRRFVKVASLGLGALLVARQARAAVPEPTTSNPAPQSSGSGRYSYLKDGDAIREHSFEIVRRETDLSRFSPQEAEVAVRIMYATGNTDFAPQIVFSKDWVRAGRAALKAGAPIFCDSLMVAQGINRRYLPAGNQVLCTLDDPRTPDMARKIGNTRSAGAMELWRERLGGSIVAIGNAPTALFHLLEMIADGAPAPAAIIGVPVGFTNVVEAKEALVRDSKVPYMTVLGRQGGSAICASTVNALALLKG